MNKLLGLIIATIGIFLSATPSPASQLSLFSNEIEAQDHCPNDVVVWLNLPTGIWHARGARWYGRTKQGAYVCRDEAASAGDRGSLNGS